LRFTAGSTGVKTMLINRDFLEFIKLLNTHKVKHVIVGAYVRAFYGRPRYTGDIDILIEPDESNALKMVKVLDDFGFGSLGLKVDDFTAPGQTIQLGQEPRRIDILTSISGVDFKTAWDNRQITEIDGIKAAFLGKDEYIKNKKSTGRTKDLADIEEIL